MLACAAYVGLACAAYARLLQDMLARTAYSICWPGLYSEGRSVSGGEEPPNPPPHGPWPRPPKTTPWARAGTQWAQAGTPGSNQKPPHGPGLGPNGPGPGPNGVGPPGRDPILSIFGCLMKQLDSALVELNYNLSVEILTLTSAVITDQG